MGTERLTRLLSVIVGGVIVTTSGGCGGNSASPTPTQAAALATSDAHERAAALLLGATTSPSAEARANATEGLSRTPARLKGVIDRLLQDENLGVRAVAAMVVGRARMSEQAGAVRPLVEDPSPFVRMAALYALRRCGENVDLSPMAVFLQDPSPRVRAQAAFLLGELGDKSALPMIREAARDAMTRAAPAEVRLMMLQIAEARVKLGDETALHEIRAALYPARPEDFEATALAAQIIGQVNDRAAIDQLVVLTARWNERKQRMPAEVRLAAAGSLARLGLPRGAFIADQFARDDEPALRAQAASVYGMTGLASNLGPLEALMGDSNELVRIAAAAGVLRMTAREGQ